MKTFFLGLFCGMGILTIPMGLRAQDGTVFEIDVNNGQCNVLVPDGTPNGTRTPVECDIQSVDISSGGRTRDVIITGDNPPIPFPPPPFRDATTVRAKATFDTAVLKETLCPGVTAGAVCSVFKSFGCLSQRAACVIRLGDGGDFSTTNCSEFVRGSSSEETDFLPLGGKLSCQGATPVP